MSKKFDQIAGITFLLIGLLFVIESRSISHSAYGSSVGPNIFPMALGLILVLLSIRLLFETMKYAQVESSNAPLQYTKFLIIFISAVIYAAVLEPLGYIISTFIFLLIAFQTMERGKWLSTILISGFFSLGVYYFFAEFLGGSLPGFPEF